MTDLPAESLRVIEQAERFCQHLPDFHLVCGLFYLDLVRSNPAQYLAHLPNIEQRFQRCLALGESAQYKSVVGTGTFPAYYNLGALYHVFGEAACRVRLLGFSGAWTGAQDRIRRSLRFHGN